jgi:peptide/nickel transport system permease protein
MRHYGRIIGRRLVHMLPIVLLATFLIFGLMQLVPGDLALTLAGDYATPELVEHIRQYYHLDQPFIVQYGQWLWSALHGDLGRSFLSQEDVAQSIMRTLPKTMLIGIMSIVIALAIGLPIGMMAALRKGSWIDSVVTTISSLGVALPSFWLAMLLASVFALSLNWFPATGAGEPITTNFADAVWHAVLPAIAVASSSVAEIARQVRSAMIGIMGKQYIRTLHAKGLSPMAIVWRHGLKNMAVTVLTLIGLLISGTLGATVVVEAIFAIPGIGSMVANAAITKDFPIIQGVVLIMVMIVIVVNLVVDLLCVTVDPRLKRS